MNEKLVNLDQLKQASERAKTAIDEVASKIPTDTCTMDDVNAAIEEAVPANVVSSLSISDIVVLTEDEYTALPDKPTTTLYLIPEEEA